MTQATGLTLRIGTEVIDCADVLRDARINYGAGYTVTQANTPATISVAYAVDPDYDLPAAGEAMQLVTTFANGTTSERFTGVVDDYEITWEAARPVLRIIGVGTTSRLARVFVGDEPWPVESDGDRATRILALADAQYPHEWIAEPGTINVRRRDVDRQPATVLLTELASSTLGALADRRDGSVAYLDGGHVTNLPAFITLDACKVLRPGYRVVVNTSQILNDVTVVYGLPTTPGDDTTRPALRLMASDSVAAHGVYADRFTTELDTEDDAFDFAAGLLARLANPTAVIPNAVVDSRALDDHAAFLGGLEILARLLLTGMPGPGPVGLDAVVDGWVETWRTSTSWSVDLTLTDVRARGAGTRWVDVPCVRWVDVDDSITWQTADTWAPCAPLSGRWIDQPSNLTWEAAGDTIWSQWQEAS